MFYFVFELRKNSEENWKNWKTISEIVWKIWERTDKKGKMFKIALKILKVRIFLSCPSRTQTWRVESGRARNH